VLDMLSEFRLPHWLIIAGSALVALGFVGLIIRRIRAPTSEQYFLNPSTKKLPKICHYNVLNTEGHWRG